MVQANIGNEAISITIENESTTVPQGEVWRVTVSALRGSNHDGVEINGAGDGIAGSGNSVTTIVAGGDEISGSAHIGGLKV